MMVIALAVAMTLAVLLTNWARRPVAKDKLLVDPQDTTSAYGTILRVQVPSTAYGAGV